MSLIIRDLWRIREVESYALSKFQPPTMLGDHQRVEKCLKFIEAAVVEDEAVGGGA